MQPAASALGGHPAEEQQPHQACVPVELSVPDSSKFEGPKFQAHLIHQAHLEWLEFAWEAILRQKGGVAIQEEGHNAGDTLGS